jgi:mRNA interferase MazF
MTYVTIEAEIAGGKVIPAEGAQLPERGRALVTLLPETPHLTNWDAVEASIGILKRPNLDSGGWQRDVRAEWDR